jgi:transcriptional regulator with XRE-family HTH domain
MATATPKEESRQHAEPDAFENVRYLRRRTKLTEADLADATGASTRSVRRWLKADMREVRAPRFTEQIDDLRMIVKELEDSMTAKGIRQWLRARSRYLDGKRPIDVLRAGGFDDVLEAARSFREGDYL